jgi:hypothetical protein
MLASLHLLRRGNGIFKIEDQYIGVEASRLFQGAGIRARHV